MAFGFGLSFPRGGGSLFSPASLFAASEPGAWYDPSDLTTLFTDSAGTTPVTAPNQTVGLMLDKSQGLALGPELVVNGDFSGGSTGWSVSGDWVIQNGRAEKLTSTANSNLTSSASVVENKSYLVTFDIISVSGTVTVQTSNVSNATTANFTSVGSVRCIITAASVLAGSRDIVVRCLTASTAVVDNISVKLLAGNHATQATVGQRPIYGINPITGTRNLLTFTEQFDNAYWTKQNITITADAAIAPDGTTTAEKLVPTAVSVSHQLNRLSIVSSQVCVLTFYAKESGYTTVAALDGTSGANGASFNISTGVATNIGTGVGSMTALPNGWYLCTLLFITTGVRLYVPTTSSTFVGDGTSGVFLWGAQLETGSTATAYQKVVTQYEVTEAGVASASYLAFDGSVSGMVTNTITPAIDKAQVFAGVRKLSDAAIGIVAELSASWTSNAGSLILAAPNSATPNGDYASASRGNAVFSGTQSAATGTIAAPVTNVITTTHDIAGDLTVIRSNGVQLGTATGDKGTGNFLAYPLYIGRRGGTLFPFNGRIYSLIVRFGANLTDGQITSTEIYVGDKTGVNIPNNISPTIFARDDTAVLDRFNAIIERRTV